MTSTIDRDIVIDLREGGDWSLDLCFAGLVQNLGPQRVVDFPRKGKHREWGYHEKLPDGQIVSTSWGKERRTLGYTPLNRDVPAFSQFDIFEARDSNQINRIWLDERMESFAKYRELGLDKCDAKVIVVAGHDRFWNQSPSFVASLYGQKLRGMLLDNWYPEYANLPFPTKRIGWSTNFDHYWERPIVRPEKDIDISFVGYNSHPDRARYIEHIERKWSHLKLHIVLERRPDSFDNFVPKSQMFDIMLRSKICLNLRGAADRGKTLRAYEIPYVGSFMLSQRVDDPGLAQDFTEFFECDYFDGEKDLDEAIAFWLENEDEREQTAAAGHVKALGPLSVKERWREVLEWVNR